MIQIRNLNKTYITAEGPLSALTDVNLEIDDGQIFGIIGLSGAGKSTLVRCINLLERPTSGEVIIDGEDITKIPEKQLLKMRQSIGMIFQGFNLFLQRTALQNVCYPLEIAGVKKEEAVKRALELLELVGIPEKRNAYPSQLSGGQKQRVAIARALATRPKYLLCDEATSALDPTTTQSILNLLREINQNLGVTIIIITHEMKIIEQICEKVAIIDHSRIAETGFVRDIFTNPKSEISKTLVAPDSALVSSQADMDGYKIRLVFNGEESTKPVVASLVLECGVPVNILYANTKNIDGKAYGQMLLQLSEDGEDKNKVKNWLDENKISYTTEFRQERNGH